MNQQLTYSILKINGAVMKIEPVDFSDNLIGLKLLASYTEQCTRALFISLYQINSFTATVNSNSDYQGSLP